MGTPYCGEKVGGSGNGCDPGLIRRKRYKGLPLHVGMCNTIELLLPQLAPQLLGSKQLEAENPVSSCHLKMLW